MRRAPPLEALRRAGEREDATLAPARGWRDSVPGL